MRLLLLGVICGITPLSAQLPGFTPANAPAQVALEARLRAVPDTAMAQRHMRTLAVRPHVAGSPAQVATADYVLQQMASWGLDTVRVEYEVFLPYHDSTVVEVVGATRTRLDLSEPSLPGDPTTQEPAWPAMNGYSGAGDVTAPLVYVNFGLPADYAVLDSLGVSVRGKVVLARYGRSFRGIKAREAERHGAAALILYSDPLEDGFLKGEVYPDGPMRNPNGVQRGSIKNGQGDPSTPGWASVVGARRLDESAMGLAAIPVVPIGYANAERFLRQLGGRPAPDNWQGGLDLPYMLGDGELKARVAVWPERGPRAYKKIYNTLGIIRGRTFPDEVVITGAHRDAWSPGAVDDVSGVISVMEAARAWGEAAAAGQGPQRTMLFATWDAEEWGLIGSSEWVEEHADSLGAHAVAYLNQDVAASGRMFGSSGTASLHALMRDVAKTVAQPGDTVSVYADWARRTVTSQRPEPPLGDLGGGSDFAGFYNHLGIPSFDFGFGGPGGAYHSGYDTYTFMERFGDPGYLSHRAAGQMAAVLLARLANADVVPLEYTDLGVYLLSLADRSAREPGAEALASELDAIRAAARNLTTAGAAFARTRDRALAANPPSSAFAPANEALRRVEREFVRPAGLVDRPFLRNLVFAADRDNGYANIQFPGVIEALRDNDVARARTEASELAQRIEAAAMQVVAARDALPTP
jgi:N-acetylated-alpha-linked acidic dipeptidase